MAKLVLIYWCIVALFLQNRKSNSFAEKVDYRNKARNPRALIFPVNSCVGIVVALAIPIELPNRNVFYSYNFEANYIPPALAQDIFPGVLNRLDLVDEIGRDLKCSPDSNGTCSDSPSTPTTPKRRRKKDSIRMLEKLMSRKSFYKGIIQKMELAGYRGRDCLLRAICEVSEFAIGSHNGLLGSLFHIVLSPSASRNEKLHSDFYDAELDGLRDACEKYRKKCKESALDLITSIF
ncbi:unnamed protein product [Hermetia illucens]|uniref:Uncharacterized protein n=1 Tax=Hermetia illucens TaxID=343691 RepID=A0A7R8UU40_HERIL|nr:uncharacterized protein LOC119653400 [Hermetia illucens]CAD7087081.1 unnamed protein product [Hermetia illucens]